MNSNRNKTRGGDRARARTLRFGLALAGAAGLAAVALPSAADVRIIPPQDHGLLGVRPRAQVIARAHGAQPTESTYIFNSVENGRQVHLEVKNNVVVRAEVDGKAIPDNRVERDGDTIRLKDDKGEVLFEQTIPTSGAAAVWSSAPGFGRSFRAFSGPGGNAAAIATVEAPKVMMGVQMATPDGALRGHLGLKEGAATMLSAVHERLPAGKAGLGPYDVIVSIDGKDQAGPDDLRAALKEKKAGDTVKLGVIQKGVRKDVTLTLDAYDRKRLEESKVDAIADNQKWSGLDPVLGGLTGNWDNFGKQFQNGPGSREDMQKLIEGLRTWRGGASAGGPFVTVVPGPNGGDQRMIIESDRAAREAEARALAEVEKLHGQARKDRSSQLDDVRRQMDELQKMMQRLLEEKPDGANPDKPKDAPREGRS